MLTGTDESLVTLSRLHQYDPMALSLVREPFHCPGGVYEERSMAGGWSPTRTATASPLSAATALTTRGNQTRKVVALDACCESVAA
jgi:hypothetical protein